MTGIMEELHWRGMVYDQTEGVEDLLAREKITLYTGFDPTADSLHVGHLVPLMALARFQRHGHTPIAVAGGGTGMIGDPSGKAQERQLLSKEQLDQNVSKIKEQLARFLDFEAKDNPAQLVNNADWLLSLSLVSFLRDIGKHFTVNYMMAKDSVQSRLDSESGISFTEFSYMLLQSYDFLHLFRTHKCVLQTGGSDQWGNITAGGELIRRIEGQRAYGLVYPLITRSDGQKFGKTESGTVWLDPKRTSPYRFYQFWLNTDDQDVIRYLKFFTFLDRGTIEDLEQGLQEHPEQREPQRVLASEMTTLLHGEEALRRAEQASQVLFGGEITGLGADDVEDIFAEVPSCEIRKSQLDGEGMSFVELAIASGLTSSKGEARRLVDGGGAYVNNTKIGDPYQAITPEQSVENRFIILRKGRKNYLLVRLVE